MIHNLTNCDVKYGIIHISRVEQHLSQEMKTIHYQVINTGCLHAPYPVANFLKVSETIYVH